LVAATNATSASLYDKLSYNFIRDIAPVAAISREPQIMLVNPLVPARTVPEFIAYARANPSKISMASSGIGMECAPRAGQVEVSDLTGCAGLSKDESHGQTTFPQH